MSLCLYQTYLGYSPSQRPLIEPRRTADLSHSLTMFMFLISRGQQEASARNLGCNPNFGKSVCSGLPTYRTRSAKFSRSVFGGTSILCCVGRRRFVARIRLSSQNNHTSCGAVTRRCAHFEPQSRFNEIVSTGIRNCQFHVGCLADGGHKTKVSFATGYKPKPGQVENSRCLKLSSINEMADLHTYPSSGNNTTRTYRSGVMYCCAVATT